MRGKYKVKVPPKIPSWSLGWKSLDSLLSFRTVHGMRWKWNISAFPSHMLFPLIKLCSKLCYLAPSAASGKAVFN